MYFEILLSAFSLSLDAFAASLGIGACLSVRSPAAAARVAVSCGGFQFAMPLAGWWLGSRFLETMSGYDHWIAFILLSFVGGNMIRESLAEKKERCPLSDPSCGVSLFAVAVATSIDALVVGVGFAALSAPVMPLAWAAGGITALLCFIGVLAGFKTARLLGRKAEFLGGAVLCLIGANILRVSLTG